jgi:hypothetical protein
MDKLGYESNIRIEPRTGTKAGRDALQTSASPEAPAARPEKTYQEQEIDSVVLYMNLFDINRTRAENLVNAGYKNLDDLRDAIAEDLVLVDRINPTIAKMIIERVRNLSD